MSANSGKSVILNQGRCVRMIIYKSKIGPELAIPTFAVLVGTALLMAFDGIWVGSALMFLLTFYIGWMFLNTRYTIKGDVLSISSGFLYKKTIHIHEIKRLEETRNPLSSPATSIDRMEILYNKYDSILISPKDKAGFVKELTRINPQIQVKWRKRKD